jgi:hypothetical protein
MKWLPRKKTREEQVKFRTENVFAVLVGSAEFEFTDLETVQILNNVRRKLVENLEAKKGTSMEQSVIHSQKASEIVNVLKYLE